MGHAPRVPLPRSPYLQSSAAVSFVVVYRVYARGMQLQQLVEAFREHALAEHHAAHLEVETMTQVTERPFRWSTRLRGYLHGIKSLLAKARRIPGRIRTRKWIFTRASTRVAVEIPVTISGIDERRRIFIEATHTLDVQQTRGESRHGKFPRCRYPPLDGEPQHGEANRCTGRRTRRNESAPWHLGDLCDTARSR